MEEINRNLIEKGMEEILKVKIGNLETLVECASLSEVKVAFEEYMMAIKLAKSFSIDTEKYQKRINLNSKKLKENYGIEIE